MSGDLERRKVEALEEIAESHRREMRRDELARKRDKLFMRVCLAALGAIALALIISGLF